MTEPNPVGIVAADDVAGYPTSDNQTLADQANAAIADYCGWHVAPVKEETIAVESDGSGVVFLPTLRIESISEVTVDGDPVTLERRDWSQNGWLRVPAAAGVPVTITLRHGFAVTASMRQAGLLLVAAAKASPDGRVVRSRRLGEAQIDYATPSTNRFTDSRLPGEVQTTLDRYVLPPRP